MIVAIWMFIGITGSIILGAYLIYLLNRLGIKLEREHNKIRLLFCDVIPPVMKPNVLYIKNGQGFIRCKDEKDYKNKKHEIEQSDLFNTSQIFFFVKD